jgi:photosystem II stability/assembly factor-like uncharacterized protein
MVMRIVRPVTLVAACLGLLLAAAACGSKTPGSGTSTPASPSAAPTASGPVTSSPGTSPTPPPSAGAAPAGFKAASVTFVSANQAFVLGTAHGAGTVVLRTDDRGQSWVALAAPGAPLGGALSGGARTVWGVRFATPSHGFVFGHGLWETTDGGRHWALDSSPSGTILSLAAIDGRVLAIVRGVTSSSPATLLRRALAGGSWSAVTTVHIADLSDPNDLIATQAGTAAVLDGTSVVVTTDGGLIVTRHATPALPTDFSPGSLTVTGGDGLALLAVGQGFTGHTVKRVYVSGGGGAVWQKAGAPSAAGDGGALAAGSARDLLLATASAASWIDRSTDAGATWATRLTYGDGGMGWADLGFTTVTHAVVVHGPADTPGDTDGRPGQLLLSADGGATWRAVSF